jgi:hypothetical protein
VPLLFKGLAAVKGPDRALVDVPPMIVDPSTRVVAREIPYWKWW